MKILVKNVPNKEYINTVRKFQTSTFPVSYVYENYAESAIGIYEVDAVRLKYFKDDDDNRRWPAIVGLRNKYIGRPIILMAFPPEDDDKARNLVLAISSRLLLEDKCILE